MSDRKNGTIDVETMKNHSTIVPELKLMDNVKIFQTLLLTRLPAERTNGLINLIYATRPSAKEDEIQSALVSETTLEIKIRLNS